MTTRIRIRKPDDWHVHLREGEMLRLVAPYTAKAFARALVMPNTQEPIKTADDVVRYHSHILTAAGHATFVPLVTAKLMRETSVGDIESLHGVGVRALKLYPEGATTNSAGTGIVAPQDVKDYGIYERMSELGMVLSVHAEDPGVFVMDREASYLRFLDSLARDFPKLKVVIEHATTEAAVEFVREHGENVAATITAHHLALTLDDVVGGMLSPHNFCKPVAKRPEDKAALKVAVFSGERGFFFGSDSAPHARGKKECASGCAGCFTAPCAVELLLTIAERVGADFANVEKFLSEHGAKFYGFGLSEEKVEYEREPFVVPAGVGGEDGGPIVVPFMAGKTLEWRRTA